MTFFDIAYTLRFDQLDIAASLGTDATDGHPTSPTKKIKKLNNNCSHDLI